MAVPNAEQREALAAIRRKIGDDPLQMAAGRVFADNLRTALPGVDDTDIGLVLVLVGAHAINVALSAAMSDRDTAEGEAALHSLAAITGAAALDLTDLHTREETP